jgi:NAD(P)-dependent dehydrogenase (short-subunit alcohol dehydrogenase family)
MTRFRSQTALVTGGTGGQGTSHVRAFHAEGANVVIGDIDADRGAALAEELGDRAHFTKLDVTDETSWSAAIRAAEDIFGGLNALVNNAGVQNPPAPIEHTGLREPADVTQLLLFLSSSAAAFITGSEYVIDGGLLLGPALQSEPV